MQCTKPLYIGESQLYLISVVVFENDINSHAYGRFLVAVYTPMKDQGIVGGRSMYYVKYHRGLLAREYNILAIM